MPDKILNDAAGWLMTLLTAIAPGALGSAVAIVHAGDAGLSWSHRLAQWMAGCGVSYYVTLGLAEIWPVGPFLTQSIGFLVGVAALKATPKFIDSATAFVGDAFAAARARLLNRKGGE